MLPISLGLQGEGALDVLRPLTSLVTLFFVTTKLSVNRVDLFRRGTWMHSFLVN